MSFTFVIKSAEENIRLIDPDVVSRHPSIFIRLLNLAVFKTIDEDTVYYHSDLTQQHKPKILENFHFQSSKILWNTKYFTYKMLLWTVFITLDKNLVTERIWVFNKYLKI